MRHREAGCVTNPTQPTGFPSPSQLAPNLLAHRFMETKCVQKKVITTLPLSGEDHITGEDNAAAHDLVDLVASLQNLRIKYRLWHPDSNFSDPNLRLLMKPSTSSSETSKPPVLVDHTVFAGFSARRNGRPSNFPCCGTN